MLIDDAGVPKEMVSPGGEDGPGLSLCTLVRGRGFLEAPRWHRGRWWCSDLVGHEVLAVDEHGHVDIVLHVPAQPSGLGWLPDGSLLAVSMLDHRLVHREPDGAVSTHADLSAWCGGALNDMVVSADGRAYVGECDFDVLGGAPARPGRLLRVDPDGTSSIAAEGLLFPNGAVISEDGRTLIVAESLGRRLTAFTIGTDGALTDRRVWAQLGPEVDSDDIPALGEGGQPTPDGCALDDEGHVWVADPTGGRCCRIAPEGDVVDVVAPPSGLTPWACALGGEDGRTLLVCAAPHGLVPGEGVLLVTTVERPGVSRAARTPAPVLPDTGRSPASVT